MQPWDVRRGQGAIAARRYPLGEDFANVRNGEAARLVFTLNLESAVDLQAELIPDGPDAWDATIEPTFNCQRPSLRVYCPPSLASFRHALSSVHRCKLIGGTCQRS